VILLDVCLKYVETTTIKTTTSTRRLTKSLTTLVTKKITTPSTTKTTTKASSVTTTSKLTTKAASPIFNQTDASEDKTTEATKDYDELGNNNIEDEHDMEQDDISQATTNYESDDIVNEKFTMKTKDNVDFSFIIKASAIAISTIFFSFFIVIVGYKQYKKSTNPLNYKEKHENASKKANEEFSEIRYLTSDETLDFNLATPDGATEL
jgi:hypothetical protein